MGDTNTSKKYQNPSNARMRAYAHGHPPQCHDAPAALVYAAFTLYKQDHQQVGAGEH